MIFSKEQLFSERQAITETTYSANVIDLKTSGIPFGAASVLENDLGKGDGVTLLAQVTQDFETEDDATLTFSIETSNNEDMSSSDIIYSIGPISADQLIAGWRVPLEQLPRGYYKRYLALKYTVSTGSFTQGKFYSGFSLGNGDGVVDYEGIIIPDPEPEPENGYKGTIEFDERSGQYSIFINTLEFLKVIWVTWAENYAYQGNELTTERLGDNEYGFTLDYSNIDVSIEGETSVVGNDVIMSYTQTITEAREGITGGHLRFTFNTEGHPDSSISLNEDEKSFTISDLEGVGDITISFENISSSININNSGTEHVMMFGPDLEVGETTNTVTFSLPPEIEVIPSIDERLGTPETWNTGVLSHIVSPVDLRYLNVNDIPAGTRGKLTAVGDNLVFEDETIGRFWGCNIQAYTLLSDNNTNAAIEAHAERIARLGYNLVRFHHMDSWSYPNIFGDGPNANTLTISSTSLSKIDKWIYELKIRGIYIWMDLHSQRFFVKDTDGITNTEIFKGAATSPLKYYIYLDEDVHQLMIDFNDVFLNHENSLTGLTYAEDPAIVATLISNENDLTHHGGNAYLATSGVPIVSATFMSLADDFATEHSLVAARVKETWLAGPSKIFLNQLEHEYNEIMIGEMVTSGYTGLFSTTNTWGANPMFSLPALTDGDIIDVHAYDGTGFLTSDPRSRSNLASWIGMGQVVGKPISVTEWNIEKPLGYPYAYDRFASTVYVAATSCLQGWDMLMMYGYNQQSITLANVGNPDTYSAFNDPAQMALQPAAALLYRHQHVAPAEETYVLSLNQADFYGNAITPKNSKTVRTLVDQHKFMVAIPETIELSWLTPSTIPEGATVVTSFIQDFIGEADEVVSDTGEITRNWRRKDYRIETPKSSILMGWIGGKTVSINGGRLIAAMNNPFCAVAFQAMDNVATDTSDEMLITVCARSDNLAGSTYSSEPIDGTVKVRAKSGLTLYMMELVTIESVVQYVETEYLSTYSAGVYTFSVDETVNTYWFKLKVPD